MSHRHKVLIVEDQDAHAEDLVLSLEALDLTSLVVKSKEAALAAIDSDEFCVVLLDLKIWTTSESVRPVEEAGRSLLRELRRRFPERQNHEIHSLPIVIFSGHAEERDVALELMDLGATKVLQKGHDRRKVSDEVRGVLSGSGRDVSGACEALARRWALARKSGRLLSVPGTARQRRSAVELDLREATLTDRCLEILLHLILGKLTGDDDVHVSDLGPDERQSGKMISTLRSQLAAARGESGEIVINRWHGVYALAGDIRIGSVNGAALARLRNARIDRLCAKVKEKSPA